MVNYPDDNPHDLFQLQLNSPTGPFYNTQDIRDLVDRGLVTQKINGLSLLLLTVAGENITRRNIQLESSTIKKEGDSSSSTPVA